MAGAINPFIITDLQAISDLCVSDSVGRVRIPKTESFAVWSPTLPNDFKEGTDGSKTPVVLQMPVSTSKFTLTYKLSGTCVFPSTYVRKSNCRAVASLNGKDVIASESFEVNLPTGPAGSGPMPLPPLSKFTVVDQFPSPGFLVPFRRAGDFQWRIVCDTKPIPPTTAQDLLGPIMRLEICWLHSFAPVGPTVWASGVLRTAIDLQGVYPIGLLRWALPRPTDLSTELGFDKKFSRWWASFIVRKVNSGFFVYDTIAGKSAFGMGACGGSFDLNECLLRCFSAPTNPFIVAKPILINSFDLAALIQLGSGLLLQGAAGEVFDSQWVCKSPFGFSQTVNPIGLSPTSIPPIDAMGVNNPFFYGLDPPNTDSFIPVLNQKNTILRIQNRAWIEVSFTALNSLTSTGVLDASCLGSRLEVGDKDRSGYTNAHIEPPSKNSSATEKPLPTDDGTYFSNGSFSVKGAIGQPGIDNTPIGRVGVYGIDGVTEPRSGPAPAPFIPVPPTLRADIVKTIANSGKNPLPPVVGFNDASLKAINVFPVLLGTGQSPLGLRPESFDALTDDSRLKVARGVSTVTYSFSAMRVTNTVLDGRLEVKISVFDKINEELSKKVNQAYEAMVFELSKYERDIVTAVKTCAAPDGKPVFFGTYSLQTPRSVLCMRDNLFIEMTIIDPTRPDKDAFNMVVAMMARLNDYLSKHSVRYSQVRRPNLTFVDAPKLQVSEDEAFSLQLRHVDLLAPQMRAIIDRGRLLVSTGPSYSVDDKNGPQQIHKFQVLKKQFPQQVEITNVTIAGAHPDTFHPGMTSFSLKVVGKPVVLPNGS